MAAIFILVASLAKLSCCLGPGCSRLRGCFFELRAKLGSGGTYTGSRGSFKECAITLAQSSRTKESHVVTETVTGKPHRASGEDSAFTTCPRKSGPKASSIATIRCRPAFATRAE